MKNAAVFFGSVLLKYLGISQRVSAVMPTELVRLEIRHMYEDFNFQTTDGAWLHFEFESDAPTLADLKRFWEYEAATSRTYEVAVNVVITKILSSSFKIVPAEAISICLLSLRHTREITKSR